MLESLFTVEVLILNILFFFFFPHIKCLEMKLIWQIQSDSVIVCIYSALTPV